MAITKVTRTLLSTGIVDNSNATAITIDSSENVGIGITPRARLDIFQQTNRTSKTGTTRGVLHLQDGDTAANNELTAITFESNSNNASAIIGQSLTNNGSELFFGTSNGYASGVTNTAMTINPSGNVGIGTSSPSSVLEVAGTGDADTGILTTHSRSGVGYTLRLNNTNNGANKGSGIKWSSGGFDTGAIIVRSDATAASGDAPAYMTFHTSADGTEGVNERMRIDSSGNVLVSKTSSSITNTGTTFEAGGRFFTTANGQEAAILNRQTSDGEILQFRKDNTTTVGSIGTEGGDIVIGTGDTAVQFADSLDCIRPFTSSGSGNGGRDNAIDLGASGQRFKDFYLSGGAYLGGTGSANHLDDYEEGTFTPSFSGATLSTATGSYTKIGNQVTVHFRVITSGGLPSSGGQVQVGNLPFTIGSGFGGVGGLYVGPSNVSSATGGGGTIVPYVTGGETFIRFLNVDTGTFGYTLWGELEVSANNVVTAIGTVTYQV